MYFGNDTVLYKEIEDLSIMMVNGAYSIGKGNQGFKVELTDIGYTGYFNWMYVHHYKYYWELKYLHLIIWGTCLACCCGCKIVQKANESAPN